MISDLYVTRINNFLFAIAYISPMLLFLSAVTKPIFPLSAILVLFLFSLYLLRKVCQRKEKCEGDANALHRQSLVLVFSKIFPLTIYSIVHALFQASIVVSVCKIFFVSIMLIELFTSIFAFRFSESYPTCKERAKRSLCYCSVSLMNGLFVSFPSTNFLPHLAAFFHANPSGFVIGWLLILIILAFTLYQRIRVTSKLKKEEESKESESQEPATEKESLTLSYPDPSSSQELKTNNRYGCFSFLRRSVMGVTRLGF